jgi:hypothetical protein
MMFKNSQQNASWDGIFSLPIDQYFVEENNKSKDLEQENSLSLDLSMEIDQEKKFFDHESSVINEESTDFEQDVTRAESSISIADLLKTNEPKTIKFTNSLCGDWKENVNNLKMNAKTFYNNKVKMQINLQRVLMANFVKNQMMIQMVRSTQTTSKEQCNKNTE